MTAIAENSGSVNLGWDSLSWEAKRGAVLAEADFICEKCHESAGEVDHIWPRAEGGGDDRENLQALCRGCNARKGAQTLSMRTTLPQLQRGVEYTSALRDSVGAEISFYQSIADDMERCGHAFVADALACMDVPEAKSA